MFPYPVSFLLAALYVLLVVGGEDEDLFVPTNPAGSGLGRGTAGSHRPAQSLVPGMAGLPQTGQLSLVEQCQGLSLIGRELP